MGLLENAGERAANRIRNLELQAKSKAWKNARVKAPELRMAKEARSRERQARQEENRRLGLNPHTASTQTSEDAGEEEEEANNGEEVDSETAYNTFFTVVEAAQARLEVVVVDADEGSSSGAARDVDVSELPSPPPSATRV